MYFVYCDGGSRGNPGNAGIGVVIKNEDTEIFTLGEYIGIQTNNVAEYRALIAALKKLADINAENVKIHLDSELVVKQVNGIYKVKNIDLQKLFAEVTTLKKNIKGLEIVHVRREFNKEADALVNLALDSFEKGENSTIKTESSQSLNSHKLPMTVMLQNKVEVLKKVIKGYGSLVVGYSGGIDSSLLSYVSSRILEDKFVAVTIIGAQSISSEISYAKEFVKAKKINHVEIPVSIFENKDLMKNTEYRCYYCKLANFQLLKDYGKDNGYDIVADGGNIDDLSEDRPGLKAIKELGIKSPFVEAGMSKKDIKDFAEYLELGMNKRESNTCLITRIPINSEITEKRLKKVDNCEEFLKENGFKGFRVRDMEDTAIIEFKDEINVSKKIAQEITEFFKSQSYNKIYIDMGGYKIGAMSEKR